MKEQYLLLLLIGHWLCDFTLQTHEQATNKYKGGYYLLGHVFTYSLIMSGLMLLILPGQKVGIFLLITFISHFLTDYLTSNIGKEFWDKKDFHNGFVVVGFDQILHYLQLYLTVKLLLV